MIINHYWIYNFDIVLKAVTPFSSFSKSSYLILNDGESFFEIIGFGEFDYDNSPFSPFSSLFILLFHGLNDKETVLGDIVLKTIPAFSKLTKMFFLEISVEKSF